MLGSAPIGIPFPSAEGEPEEALSVSPVTCLAPSENEVSAVACELCCPSVGRPVAAFCHFWQRGRDPKGTKFQQDL